MHALKRKVNGALFNLVVGEPGAAKSAVAGILAMTIPGKPSTLKSSGTITTTAAVSPRMLEPISRGFATSLGFVPLRAPPSPPPPYVQTDRVVDAPYKVQPKRVFAVIDVGGTQYKVTPDDVIVTEKLTALNINDVIRLERVLLLGSPSETIIGRPYIHGACVTAAVEEQFLDGKVIIFHKRRRKNSRRTKGHRQPLTTLRILEVEGISGCDDLSESS
jgi:ribosomal protein L21